MKRPTAEEIEAAKTPAGGWTRAILAAWGVPWPPPKGWRRRLLGLPPPTPWEAAVTKTAAAKARALIRSARKAEEAAARKAAKEAAQLEKHRPTCAECGGREAQLVTGEAVWPHRRDLYEARIWVCPCGARVGCHKGTNRPKGYPCGDATRRARQDAHAALDPLWQAKMRRDGVTQQQARGAAYRWLAGQLGIAVEDTHISMFNEATCRRVVQVCSPGHRKAIIAAKELEEEAV